MQDLNFINFTYSVKYSSSEKKVASRWDRYKIENERDVHWGNIYSSFAVNLALAILIHYIMRRILLKDIRAYISIDNT